MVTVSAPPTVLTSKVPGLLVLMDQSPTPVGTMVVVLAPVGVTLNMSTLVLPLMVIVAVAVTLRCSTPVKLIGPPITPMTVLASRSTTKSAPFTVSESLPLPLVPPMT